MQHATARPARLVDLGKATVETKGAWGKYSDEVLMHNAPRLAHD